MVPNLRFLKFNQNYETLQLKNTLKIKSGKDQKQVEVENGIYNIYGTGGIIGHTNTFLYDKESVGIGRKGTIDKPVYFNQPFWTVDTLFYSEIYEGFIPKYIFYLFQTINWKKYNTSTGVPSLTSSSIENIEKSFPCYDEQLKVANFLTMIDMRIETQIKIIDRLYSQIKYIKGQILNMTTITETKPLGQLCNISTGKRDANEMKSNGSYKFFTCSKDDYCIDTYSFDGEALIISGNGELGLIKYYNGKFDAYQRTYVLQNFKCHPKYLMYVLQNKLPKKIEKEKNVGAMPYIVLKTLTSINIDILNMHDQIKIVNILNKFEEKLENDKILLELFEKEKSFLLKNLFV